jgi:hypothetical protein
MKCVRLPVAGPSTVVRLHEEISNDYRDMIYAATRAEVEARRKGAPSANRSITVMRAPQ